MRKRLFACLLLCTALLLALPLAARAEAKLDYALPFFCRQCCSFLPYQCPSSR